MNLSVVGKYKISWPIVYGLTISSYFILSALNGCSEMLFSQGFMGIYYIISIILSAIILIKNSSIIDWLFLFFIATLIASSALQNYEYYLFYDGVKSIIPLVFFLFGRNRMATNYNIIQYAIPVYIITSLIGLVLFFVMPSWYIYFKADMYNEDYSNDYFWEMYRLSAFWRYPYWISYGGAIIVTYIICQSILTDKLKRKDTVSLVYVCIIIILAQQRAAIVWVLALIILYYMREFFFKKNASVFLLIILMLFAVYLGLSVLSNEYLERYIMKFEQMSEGNFVKERSDLFRWFYNNDITFFGDGIGRYGHAGVNLKQHSITDQGYLKIIFEMGIWGALGFSFFFLISIANGLKNFKNKIFELLVVAFFLFSMFGSNSIFGRDSHAIVFWFCLGRLSNSYLKYNIIRLRNAQSTYYSLLSPSISSHS